MRLEDQLKATVVSIFPLEIAEPKPGLYPGYFVIPAAPFGELSYLIVGDAVYYQETKNDIPTAVKVPFHTVADSIVMDFIRSHIGRIVEVAEPGVFWVPGAYDSQEAIRRAYPDKIALAENRQKKWFEELVKIADDTYSRTRRHTSVSTLQRIAAQYLGVARPWVLRTNDSANTCPFCKAETPYGAVKCPNCREIIDHAAYRELVANLDGGHEEGFSIPQLPGGGV